MADAMTGPQKCALAAMQDDMVKNMVDVDTVLDGLKTKGILTSEIVEIIEAEKTDSNKVRELLEAMAKRSGRAFYDFIDVLKTSGNKALAERLELCYTNLGAQEMEDGMADAMTGPQKGALEAMQDDMVKSMVDVDTVLDGLKTKGILTSKIVQIIKAEKTDSKKVRELLKVMAKRSGRAFYDFIEVLRASGNKELAKRLESRYKNLGAQEMEGNGHEPAALPEPMDYHPDEGQSLR